MCCTVLFMYKFAVVEYYGSQTKTAQALGITKSAVSQWKHIIPQGMAYKAQAITGGRLLVDPSIYRKSAVVA